MEDKRLIVPPSAPEMSRTDDLPISTFYKEKGVRKLNLIIGNNIQNVLGQGQDLSLHMNKV